MRVVLAHKLYKITGGAEVFFHECDRVLRNLGHETHIIATGARFEVDRDNVDLLDAPAYDSPSLLKKVLSFPKAVYDPKKRDEIYKILKKVNPDILHIFAINVHITPAIIFAANDLNIPIVATFNDYKHICPNYKLFHHGKVCFDCRGFKFFSAVKNQCCKESLALSAASMIEAYVHRYIRVYDKIDHFTFSSDFLAEITQDFWPSREMSWSKLRNPYNSIEKKIGTNSLPYGLYFGRIVEEKGLDLLVEASKIAKNIPLKIVGDGPDYKKICEKIKAENLTNLELLGPVWGDSLDEMIDNCRFVVVPSIWHENFPYVINQAFAKGKPVIGTNRGGIPELVKHGERGLIIDADSPADLARAMGSLMSNPTEAVKLGGSAKAWSDDVFSDEKTAGSLMQAYEKAIHEHRNHRR